MTQLRPGAWLLGGQPWGPALVLLPFLKASFLSFSCGVPRERALEVDQVRGDYFKVFVPGTGAGICHVGPGPLLLKQCCDLVQFRRGGTLSSVSGELVIRFQAMRT